jgi:DNA-binding NarL/FixJ family response regulator
MENRIKILLTDDHPIVRNGLKQILETDPKFIVAREAGNGEAALEILLQEKMDIVVVDIDMPKMNGLELVSQILKHRIPVETIMMTMYKDESIFNRSMDLGVKGYVLKDNAITDILNCVRSIVDGKYYISPLISEYLVRRSGRTAKLPGIDELTDTEKKVLKLLAEMKTNKEIADELYISTKTVETHRNNICRKLDLHGSHALLKFALQHKSYL